MSDALFTHTRMQRGSLFGFVALAHVSLLAMASLAKVPEQPVAKVIMVEMLPMAPGVPTPAPVVQPEPVVVPPPPVPRRTRPVRPRRVVPVERAPEPLPVAVAETSAPVPEAPVSDAPTEAPVAAPASSAPSNAVQADAAPAGGGETPARFDADYLSNPKPPYPAMSRRMREEGKVVLRVLVSAKGSAENLEIKTSSGSTRLDDSALRTVRHWKFIPARRGNIPVQSWVLVPLIFKLDQ